MLLNKHILNSLYTNIHCYYYRSVGEYHIKLWAINSRNSYYFPLVIDNREVKIIKCKNYE
jgi:hypothetical protein